LFFNKFSVMFLSTFAPMVKCENRSKRDAHGERRASQKSHKLEGIVLPDFTLDPRVDRKKLLHARKLTQRFHRDLGVKFLTEIKPHKLDWSELAKAKRDATKQCAELLDLVADDASESRAAEIEDAFDIINEITKKLELEMNYRDEMGDRQMRTDPYANEAMGETSKLAADGITWTSADVAKEDDFALRSDQKMTTWARARGAEDYSDLSLGRYFRSMAVGAKTDTERRALSEGTDSAGGFTVPTILSSQLIDALRAASVVQRAGAQTVPLTSDSQSIAKVASDPTPAFRNEAASIGESDPTFSTVTFTPRSLAVMVKCSRELLDDSLNIGTALPNIITSAMAAEMDRVALEGTGVAPQPTGLRLQSGIGETALNAALSSYAPLLTAQTGILTANGGPVNAMVMHPRDAGTLAGLTDTTGQPLNVPPAIAGVPMLTTSSIQVDAGAGNDESNLYVGNFTSLMIGMRNDIRVEVLRERYADTHQYAFVAHMRFDIAIAHAASFHKISGITG
jgi:HK97 family phage major capsid protein